MNAQSYLLKHSFSGELIGDFPDKKLSFCIIIPSYNEPYLFDTLNSILALPSLPGTTEVIVILNHPENSPDEIKKFHDSQYHQLLQLASATMGNGICIKAVQPIALSEKWAGVGMARKLGMDEAIRRFSKIEKEGILCNVDADCLVDSNYLNVIDTFFKEQPLIQAGSFGFVHHTRNCNTMEKEAISWYELHLRLYISWQKIFKYPYAYQTLGSCFGVRTESYRQQGGMNRRKAGEDFYFLHKFSAINKLAALDKVLVYPSGRISNRVPFGTGKSVGQMVTQFNEKELFTTYNPWGIELFCNKLFELHHAYEILQTDEKNWKKIIKESSLSEFLDSIDFTQALKEILDNCENAKNFEKRLSRYFNPFLLMKFLHFSEQHSISKIPILESFEYYLKYNSSDTQTEKQFTAYQALEWMRSRAYPDYKPISDR